LAPTVYHLERADEVGPEEIRPAAVIGQGRDGRDDIGVAHEAAKAGLHAVDRDQDPGGDAVGGFKAGVEVGVLGLAASALGDDCFRAAHLQELVQTVFEAFLVPVGADCGLGIRRGHQGRNPAIADAFSCGLGRHLGFPAFIIAAGVAATGSLGRPRQEAEKGWDGNTGKKGHGSPVQLFPPPEQAALLHQTSQPKGRCQGVFFL
jgi:hypothetical protein